MGDTLSFGQIIQYFALMFVSAYPRVNQERNERNLQQVWRSRVRQLYQESRLPTTPTFGFFDVPNKTEPLIKHTKT